jgi:hypothetical protein
MQVIALGGRSDWEECSNLFLHVNFRLRRIDYRRKDLAPGITAVGVPAKVLNK